MTVFEKKYVKNCPRCGEEQSYGRKDHYNSAVRGDWLCKSCANHDNNFKGRIGPMPITWFEMKRKGGLHRGYAWELTPEDIVNMWQQQEGICALSGIPIGWSKKGLTATVSIDRIDSSEGYIKDNVQLLHKDINMMKQSFSQEHFVALCRSVADKEKW
jgi:hypothetical protein